MNNIKKAVIPIAGYGSRMFPETLFINKALLPIGNKPVILFLLEELLNANITDVYIIISPNQSSIIDLLKPTSEELRNKFKDNKEIKSFNKLISSFKFHYTIQNTPNGLARALLLLKNEINEPFALLLGDNIVIPTNNGISYLIEQYKTYNTNIIGVQKVKKEEINKYGVITSNNYTNPIVVNDFLEKPQESKSNIVSLGRYVLNNTIFDYIQEDINKKDELLLPKYIIKEKTLAFLLDATWLDVGTKESFAKANIFINSF